jgi:hypothetical protein
MTGRDFTAEETMKPGPLYSTVIVFLFLSIVSGCGRSAPPPIVNPPAVGTSLASTARALARQTEAANPFTKTPAPTATETLTPTPKISLNGMSLAVGEDQSTVFIDHKLGYQLTIPPGWMPVRINEQEYYKAFAMDSVLNNSVITDFLTKMEKQDANLFRLSAIDIQTEHIDSGLVSVITVILQPEDGRTLEDWAKSASAAARNEGYQFISSQFVETETGRRVLAREESWSSVTAGKRYFKRYFFDLPSGILTISLEANFESKDLTLPDLEQIINNLTVLNP